MESLISTVVHWQERVELTVRSSLGLGPGLTNVQETEEDARRELAFPRVDPPLCSLDWTICLASNVHLLRQPVNHVVQSPSLLYHHPQPELGRKDVHDLCVLPSTSSLLELSSDAAAD